MPKNPVPEAIAKDQGGPSQVAEPASGLVGHLQVPGPVSGGPSGSPKKAPRSPKKKTEAELGFFRGPPKLIDCERCIRAAMNRKKDEPPPTGDCWSVLGDEGPSAKCWDCRAKKQSCRDHGVDIAFAWAQYKPFLQSGEISTDSENCRKALKTLLKKKRDKENAIIAQKRKELKEALEALTPVRIRRE